MIFELTTENVFSSKTIFEIFDTFIFVCFLILHIHSTHDEWRGKLCNEKKSCLGIYIIPLNREYLMIIYRGPGFLAVVWFGSFATPSPTPGNKLSLFLSLPVCRPLSLQAYRGWGGDRQKSPVLYKYLNTLCFWTWLPEYSQIRLKLWARLFSWK